MLKLPSKKQKKNSALLLVCLLAACGHGGKPALPEICRLETYAFNGASALKSRIGPAPDNILNYFRLADKRADYAAYPPSGPDKALVLAYLRLLPPVYERVFRERCVGIYFVSGFAGNGVTSWVIGPGNNVYFYIVLNPASLGADLSATLTERERSCFIPAPGWDVTVNAGKKYRGLLYALFHEGTHGLDYAAGITPYVDDGMPAQYFPLVPASEKFFYRSWEAYSRPESASDFPGRDRISFYGLGGGPKLRADEARALYSGLGGTGFASLYGARSWAEDLAELETFGLITGKLSQPYIITLKTPAKKYIFRPMSGQAGARAKEALGFLETLWSE